MWGGGEGGRGEADDTRKLQQPGLPLCRPALFTSSNLNANEIIDDLGALCSPAVQTCVRRGRRSAL